MTPRSASPSSRSSSSSVPASSTETCNVPASKRSRCPSLSHRAYSYRLFETTMATTLSSGAPSGGVMRSTFRRVGSERAAWSVLCATRSLSCL
jgi:hypothetical protein